MKKLIIDYSIKLTFKIIIIMKKKQYNLIINSRKLIISTFRQIYNISNEKDHF